MTITTKLTGLSFRTSQAHDQSLRHWMRGNDFGTRYHDYTPIGDPGQRLRGVAGGRGLLRHNAEGNTVKLRHTDVPALQILDAAGGTYSQQYIALVEKARSTPPRERGWSHFDPEEEMIADAQGRLKCWDVAMGVVLRDWNHAGEDPKFMDRFGDQLAEHGLKACETVLQKLRQGDEEVHPVDAAVIHRILTWTMPLFLGRSMAEYQEEGRPYCGPFSSLKETRSGTMGHSPIDLPHSNTMDLFWRTSHSDHSRQGPNR